jgi:RNA polymerase sigma factor (sigma-70 family)
MYTVENNINLVRHTLKKYFNNGNGYGHLGFDYDDLLQIGCIGLMKASSRFDESLGFAFSTYAVKWIAGEIYKEFSSKSALIRYPKDVKEISNKIFKSEKNYSLKSIMKDYNVTEYTANIVIECLRNFNLKSLDEPVFNYDNDNEEVFLGDMIPADDYNVIDLKLELESRLSVLNKKEREIIELALKENNQTEIANKIGLSQTTVSRYIRTSLNKINKYFNNEAKVGI